MFTAIGNLIKIKLKETANVRDLGKSGTIFGYRATVNTEQGAEHPALLMSAVPSQMSAR